DQRVPSVNSSTLGIVVFPDGTTKWFQHDLPTRQARAIDAALDVLTSDQQMTIEQIQSEHENVVDTDSIKIESVSTSCITPVGDWQEDYHFLPLENVMVDKSGLDGWDA